MVRDILTDNVKENVNDYVTNDVTMVIWHYCKPASEVGRTVWPPPNQLFHGLLISDPIALVTMPILEAMEEEELENLEEGGGLKEATLAGRRKVFDHFAGYWDEVGGQEMSEAFKTPEGRADFSKHLGRFVILV